MKLIGIQEHYPTAEVRDAWDELSRLQEIVRDRRGAFKLKGHDKVAILALLAKTAGIDRDQTPDALTGIGESLAAALKRFNAAKGSGRRDCKIAPNNDPSRYCG